MEYYYSKKINVSFDDALELVNEKIKEVGFGVITEIDFQQKLKEKLDVDFRKYKILGACNPEFAHKAILADDKIGIMLPCNVVVQEIDAENSEVIVMNPSAVLSSLNNTSIESLAEHVDQSMRELIEML